MNRKHKLLWTTVICIGLFSCLPVVMGGIPVAFSAPASDYDSVIHVPAGFQNYIISFEATGTIDVFLTNDTADKDAYMATGVVPSTDTIVANHTGSSGTLCVFYSDPNDIYYLYFGNRNGVTTVTGTYEMDIGSCGIPGFEIFFIFCALIATFGILWSKKRLTL